MPPAQLQALGAERLSATAAATEKLLASSAAADGHGRSLRALGEAIELTLTELEGARAPDLSGP